MDFTALIDRLGEGGTVALGGLLIGLLFGAFAQRSKFCLRAAIIEFARARPGARLAVWLFVFSGAVVGTQALIELGLLDVSESRWLGMSSSLSGAVIGGLIFGVGMVLARGCVARLLVLSATGNLRSLLSGLIIAVTAQATLRGVLSPLRDALAGLWVVGPEMNDALGHLGLGAYSGLGLGLVWLAAAIFFGVRSRVPAWGWIGGLGVGSAVAIGWWFTYTLSGQTFDPIQVESLSFTGPSADTLMLFLSPPGSPLDFDVGLVPGVFLGSGLAAVLGREFKIVGFTGGMCMWRYIIGAVLMGFGGMLAGGCAVGAGLTGGAVFAITAWVALTGMWLGAGITDLLVDRRAELAEASVTGKEPTDKAMAPAE